MNKVVETLRRIRAEVEAALRELRAQYTTQAAKVSPMQRKRIAWSVGAGLLAGAVVYFATRNKQSSVTEVQP